MKKLAIAVVSALTAALLVTPAYAKSYFEDPNPPSVGAVSVDKPAVTVGDTLTVSYDVSDPDGVRSVSPGVTGEDPSVAPDPNSGHAAAGMASSGDTTRSFGIYIDSEDAPGRRWVYCLRVTDGAGYVTTIYDETYAESHSVDGRTADLSALTWEIVAPSAVPSYKVLDGDGAKYVKGSGGGLSVRFSGEASNLASVQVDGVTISTDNYTVEAGSTVVTLKSSYLQTLSEGIHEVVAYYRDGGRAAAEFEVTAAQNSEGDSQSSQEVRDDAENSQGLDNQMDLKASSEQAKPNRPNSKGVPKTGETGLLPLLAGFVAIGMACIVAALYWPKPR
ncbi:hypothetical protein [Paratractidigestivibacter sp.]|uniref:hypothetical protein n=1 Tax=Paratractidigestivibacter sp. TaxID=2847316 RepID=UPI002AC99B5B|nr:hypothetical protein [Paratractidigestivibacter sp.]